MLSVSSKLYAPGPLAGSSGKKKGRGLSALLNCKTSRGIKTDIFLLFFVLLKKHCLVTEFDLFFMTCMGLKSLVLVRGPKYSKKQ